MKRITREKVKVDRVGCPSLMTAPKCGGQLFLKEATPFIETAIAEGERGWKHNDPIWYRDADTTEKLRLVYFIGLAECYPPQFPV